MAKTKVSKKKQVAKKKVRKTSAMKELRGNVVSSIRSVFHAEGVKAPQPRPRTTTPSQRLGRKPAQTASVRGRSSKKAAVSARRPVARSRAA